jgi:hypothetical protein
MTSTQDCSIGIVPEVTYKTPVTVSRWYEYTDESLDFRKSVKQGLGLRVGGRVARSTKRVVPTADGGGDFSVEACAKGLGLLLQACMGAGTSTLVSAATYQENFTFADSPFPFTLQKGLPQAGGTVDAYTFAGCVVSQFDFDFPNGDIVKLKATVDAADMATATAYAAPSYPADPNNLFHFAGGAITTGTFTAPTPTTMASSGTTLANVRGGSLSVNHNIKGDRYNLGGAGRKTKPTNGLRAITGKIDVEYTDATFRDAYLADTPMTLILTYTAGALGVGLETLQIAIPEVKFDGELAKTNGTDLIVQSMSFQGLDNLVAAQPLYISMRTADIAL